MKTAVIISGNLRTFLMNTREGARVCDLFMENIVKPNNADVYAYTDTNDFYFNNTQYFSTNRTIEIVNNNAYRLHDKVDFISNYDAKSIIKSEFNKLGIINFEIEDLYDATKNEYYERIYNSNYKGYNPILLIQNLRKAQKAKDLVKQKYDKIIKWRFDNVSMDKLQISRYRNHDIFFAGIHNPIIYDWFAFGKAECMEKCFLYDKLDSFINSGQTYLCNVCQKFGSNLTCHENPYEITLSVEYNIYKNVQGLNILNAPISVHPYRYKENSLDTPIEEIMKKLNIRCKLLSYNSTRDFTIREF